MSVGKYSPTVTVAYMKDRDWFSKLSTATDGNRDVDGYDSYGYNDDSVDRAGYTESDYLNSYIDSLRAGDDEYPDTDSSTPVYSLADRVYEEWSFKDGKPVIIV